MYTFIQGGLALAFVLALGTATALAAEDKQVTLMLGGKFCEFYPDNVEKALKKLPGVKTVDLKSMKGHAIVTVDTTKTKPKELVATVNQVKGSGWHCKGEIME